MHVGFVRWGNWEAILKADMKNTVCLCKLVICTVFQKCGSRSYNVQCAIRLLSYVWNVLCMNLRFVCWDNLVANLGLYVKYCMHLYSIFVYRMYYVRRLVLFVEAIEWQSWKQTSPGFSSLIIIDWSYLNKRDKKHQVRGSSPSIIDWWTRRLKRYCPTYHQQWSRRIKMGRENDITS